jgi:hypothetical protein
MTLRVLGFIVTCLPWNPKQLPSLIQGCVEVAMATANVYTLCVCCL